MKILKMVFLSSVVVLGVNAGMFDDMQKSAKSGWESAQEMSEEAMSSKTGQDVKKSGEKVYKKAKEYTKEAYEKSKKIYNDKEF